MQRRSFLKMSGSGLAIAALTPTGLFMSGCSFSVTGMVNTILNALEAILKVAEPNASWLPSLQSAITALETAEQSWQTTGTITVIEDALNTVAAVCAVIPLTEVYSPLIDVIVAGIEAVLNYFSPAGVATMKAVADPHLNRVVLKKPHAFQTYQGAFKDQFNETARGLGLTAAVIS